MFALWKVLSNYWLFPSIYRIILHSRSTDIPALIKCLVQPKQSIHNSSSLTCIQAEGWTSHVSRNRSALNQVWKKKGCKRFIVSFLFLLRSCQNRPLASHNCTGSLSPIQSSQISHSLLHSILIVASHISPEKLQTYLHISSRIRNHDLCVCVTTFRWLDLPVGTAGNPFGR